MNKIIGIIEPFFILQQLYIYKDNIKVEAITTTLDTITNDVSNLIEEYEIEEVDLKGPEKFSKKFGKEIEKSMLSKYNNSSIKIKYI